MVPCRPRGSGSRSAWSQVRRVKERVPLTPSGQQPSQVVSLKDTPRTASGFPQIRGVSVTAEQPGANPHVTQTL